MHLRPAGGPARLRPRRGDELTAAGAGSAPRGPEPGSFFHGTLADLRPGDLLTAGRPSNYRPEVVMTHVHFTALPAGAGLAAELASILAGGSAAPRVYAVAPPGDYEDDPNVTDTKFPGNPTRSYRSTAPLRVVHEVTDWTRSTPEVLVAWRGADASTRCAAATPRS